MYESFVKPNNRFNTELGIFFNTKRRIYPDHIEITYANYPIFKEEGWEDVKNNSYVHQHWKIFSDEENFRPWNPNETEEDLDRKAAHSKYVAYSRAKRSVKDIAYLNDFDFFFTITFQKEKIDRTDLPEISKKTRKFFDNLVQRKNCKYVMIAEYHSRNEENGKRAVHFHGFVKGDLNLQFKEYDNNKNPVYRWKDWKLGYQSSVIPLYGEKAAAVNYILKYISKEDKKIFGSYYWAGGKGLIRKPPYQLVNTDYPLGFKFDYEIPDTKIKMKFEYIELGDELCVMN